MKHADTGTLNRRHAERGQRQELHIVQIFFYIYIFFLFAVVYERNLR